MFYVRLPKTAVSRMVICGWLQKRVNPQSKNNKMPNFITEINTTACRELSAMPHLSYIESLSLTSWSCVWYSSFYRIFHADIRKIILLAVRLINRLDQRDRCWQTAVIWVALEERTMGRAWSFGRNKHPETHRHTTPRCLLFLASL